MIETNTADALQGGRTEETAEEQTGVTQEVDAENDSQADTNDGDSEQQNGHKKRPGGWQRKIMRLEAERAVLIDALQKFGGNAGNQKQEAREEQAEDNPPVKPARPKMADFAGKADPWAEYEAAQDKYDEDITKYHKDNLAYELRQRETVQEQKARVNEVASIWAEKLAEGRKQYSDFDDVALNEDTPMNRPTMDAIVTSEFGAEIAYYLGKHPKEAERISKLDPLSSIREVGKIEARIADQKQATDEDEEDTSQVVTTKAPKPPTPVRRATGSSAEPDDKDDYKTWLRKREAQLKRK